jgi:hypothetical protein
MRPADARPTLSHRRGLCHAVAAIIIATVGAACVEEEPRPPASVALQIGTRQSCGLFSGLDYDTACLGAVYIATRAVPSGQILLERCLTLDARTPTLGQILRGAPLIETAGLSARGVVTFEVRGLHDADDPGADRCRDANNVSHWLFWGESEPFDLGALDAAGGDRAVRIFVDCRDCAFDCAPGDCFGCAGLGEGTCPAVMPTSFCVPGVSFRCDKRCDVDEDCFEGARRCDDGVCDTREETGELCSPCALVDGAIDGVVDGCNEGFTCVGPPGSTVGFCAMSCPDTFCPDGTRCNRVGNNLAIIGG